MASSYYGTRGNSVIEMQKQLNKLGANLQVDGIWGKNTEAAYSAYKDYLGDGSNSKTTINMLKYTPLTDEQIQNTAEQKAGVYDAQIEKNNQDAENSKYTLEQKKAALSDQTNTKQKALIDAYTKSRKKLAEDTLSKGMARSSYAKDEQDESVVEQNQEAASLNSELSSSLKDIDDKISTLQTDLLSSNNILSQKKQADILDTIQSLQKQRQDTLTKVIEYNNSVAFKLRNQKLKESK